MKNNCTVAASILFLAVSTPCMAEITFENVSPARARELGINLQGKANGPKEAWIKLEFKPEGELKEFKHVSLEISDGDHFCWAGRH